MTDQDETATLTRNKDAIHEYFAAMNRQDLDGVRALFDPGATWYAPSIRRELSVDELMAAVPWVWGRLADGLHFTEGAFTAEEDRVSALATGTARTVEGDDYNNVYHFWFQLRDGRIIRGREYGDTHLIWQTLRREQS